MQTSRQIKPNAQRALLVAKMLIGGFWVFLICFTAFPAIWWPTHGILQGSVPEWILGTIALSCILGAPILFDWLSARHTVWVVSESGISINTGTKMRTLAWEEIESIQILPFSAIIRTTSKPSIVRLNWISIPDGEWLKSQSLRN
jgi:hypothetical protein